MTICVLLVALAIAPQPAVLEDRVDVVELNHFYDGEGRLVLDQLVFYDFCQATCRHQVRAWRLVKRPEQLPVRDRRRAAWVIT